MEDSGVKIITASGSEGVILRRLNSESYEIWLNNDEVVILSPKEFEEVKK